MASFRAPALKHLLSRHALPPSRHIQRRWAQVHDVRFLATHQPNHALNRYKDKLSQKAKEEGHDSISSLKEAYQDKIKTVRAETAAEIAANNQASQATAQPTSENASTGPSVASNSDPIAAAAKKTSTPGIKPLSSYLDIPKISTLPPKEIETLWRLRHASNPLSICATIPLETYNRIAGTARHNPQFILPLPREIEVPSSSSASSTESNSSSAASETTKTTAAEIHFLQWGFHPPASASASPPPTPQKTSVDSSTANTHTSTVIFTHLGAYKLHGAFAQPHTIITHHLDLADEKGLVLMNGTVMADKGVTNDEAKLLIMWLQRFYDWGIEQGEAAGGKKGEMLRTFTKGDVGSFKIEELVEEVQKV